MIQDSDQLLGTVLAYALLIMISLSALLCRHLVDRARRQK